MNLTQRFYSWIVAVPTLFAFAITFTLLSQTLQFSVSEWLTLAALWWLIHGALNGWLVLRARPSMSTMRERAIPAARVSEALSTLHLQTSNDSNVVWLGGAILFALAAFASVLRTGTGLTYFFVSGLVAAILTDLFIYAALKRSIVGEALRHEGAQYVGKEIPIARKLGVVFIGLFVAAVVAIVLLVTARVSGTLEGVALASGSSAFESSYTRASSSSSITAEKLRELDSAIPAHYQLFAIRPGGALLTADTSTRLSDDEISETVKRRRGNSSAFIAPSVFWFRDLPDGSILGMTVPFERYADVPRQITLYTAIVGLIAALFFAAATYYVSKDIASPLRKVRNLAAAMAEGRFDETPRIFTDDEISTLARSFASSRNNLRDLIARLGTSGSSIATGVKVISGGTTSLVAAAQEQSLLTRDSTRAVESVKSGAEAVLGAAEAVIEGASDTSSRAVELHASAEQVARSMDHLSESVDKISSSIIQMRAAADETSGRTDLLANIGEEVLTFVTEMDSTVAELQRSANASATISSEVRTTAAAGRDEVRRSVESTRIANEATARASSVIHELTTRIAQISQIVAVIEDIAGRTNLLSLNAAIIAAQAGDQGAGFSVVADEIRELAERTRKSTTEISGIVRAVQHGSREAVRAIEDGVVRVNENVQLAERASEALVKIANIAERSNEMATHMASSLGQQAMAATHLRTAASTMSEHIHEINRSIQEQAQGAGLLADETERVRDIAAHVKTSTDQQTFAARGITVAMEDIVGDVSTIRDHLQLQLGETESILAAATRILTIADANDATAREFSAAVGSLVDSGKNFENEVARFRLS